MPHITVIGGGAAGYTAALEGRKRGFGVTLYEKSQLGGLCLNQGCIPTKTLLEHIHMHRSVKTAAENLIWKNVPALNWADSRAYTQRMVEELGYGLRYQLKKAGVEIRVEEGVDDGSSDYVIYATGGRRIRPEVLSGCAGRVVDVTELLSLKELPERAAVIGGGVTGVECAQILHSFGTTVTIYEKENRILRNFDTECVDYLEKCLCADGITIKKQTDLMNLTEPLIICCAGVAEQENKKNGRTFCIGDCAPGKKLASDAMWEARAVIAGIAGEKNWKQGVEPSFAYTCPAISGVGMTVAQARAQYNHVTVGYGYAYANGRSKVQGLEGGFVKTVADQESGRILGIHMVGEHAENLLGEATALIELECTVKQLQKMIHPHPAICEILAESVGQL
ncbi:MAG: NAD(P)/FAD-dependent oxidoreductase [Lachnospiraceae bacterium]|nr:NAD(P)/FAD-dependent oxidoreductase [Lachnospiraceae bacterium]